jgi:hypothetical protein
VRRRLPDHHLNPDSRDGIKLAMGLAATMTALLLGLLVSSAKGTYDAQRSRVIQMAAKATFRDRVLSADGPDAPTARRDLREVIEGFIRRIGAETRVPPNPLSRNPLNQAPMAPSTSPWRARPLGSLPA